MNWQPRNDYVIFRMVDTGVSPGGVAVPEISIQGKQFFVVATGPKVEGLDIGEEVLMTGREGFDYFPLPNTKGMFLTQEKNVVLRQPVAEAAV